MYDFYAVTYIFMYDFYAVTYIFMYDFWLQSYIFLHEIPNFLPFFRGNAGQLIPIL